MVEPDPQLDYRRRPQAARRRRGALAVGAVVVLLALTGCGNDDGAVPPDDAQHSGVTGSAAPGGSPASGEAAESPRPATVENIAASAGVLQAAQLGLDRSAVASGEDLARLRDGLPDAMDGVVVAPSSCQQPLRQLNWSPVMLGEESARTDFAAEGAPMTGTVEVARIVDRGALDAYYGTVRTLLEDCPQVMLNVQKPTGEDTTTPASGPLSFAAPDVERDVDSAVFWSRFPHDADLKQQSVVLVEEAGDYVAMVSFAGPAGVEDERTTRVAEAVMDATIRELTAQQEN
ncbi:hypothetical protein [Zhihengliuella sp.]|uniref:hypothetical protein n=1 Tax=Zhihengliuella sp. TaxID=1954483 RepID=UPI002811FF94|nr:hypothetical protein [Zhihengliuella sp.]